MKKRIISIRSNGKLILQIKNDNVIVGRYINMDSSLKKAIIKLYNDLTNDKNKKKIKDFLDFRDNGKDEFCS